MFKRLIFTVGKGRRKLVSHTVPVGVGYGEDC